MQILFNELHAYRDQMTDREAQVGTFDGQIYAVYYYHFGTAVDRSYHEDVQSAINSAIEYINRRAENGRPQILDSGAC